MNKMPHVLLVDDDVFVTRAFRRRLERVGMRITAAESGFAAIQILQKSTIDVLLADYQMPGVNGEELFVAVRGDERFRDLPIMLITGKGNEIDTRAMKEKYDLNRVFFKPFRSEELAMAIGVIVAARGSSAELRPASDS